MNEHYPFTLKPLPYSYEALEPYIDATTLHFHHDKHQQAYVDNLNKALQDCPVYHDWSLKALVQCANILPEKIRTDIRNNAGGVFNHELYFNCMGAKRDLRPEKELGAAINKQFGSYEAWREKMKEAAVSQFGSGYAWLVSDPRHSLRILKTDNQNTPSLSIFRPLLLIDVWEHAYYLQYQNRRAEYVDNWFRIINWEYVEKRYLDIDF